MAEKTNGKSLNIGIIIIAIIVVVAVGFGIFKLANNNNSNWKEAKSQQDIVINDSDSKEIKVEKLQKKIELINQDIEKVQEKIDPELKNLNSLYEEYVGEMNKYQTGVPASEEDMNQAQENMQDYENSQNSQNNQENQQ